MRKTGIVLLGLALASCGKSPEGPASASSPDASAPATTATETAAAAGDTCALVADASATLGQPVTAAAQTMPNGTRSCEWKSADGRVCGSATVFGPGFNEVGADAPTNFAALSKSLAAFGSPQEVAALGDEARSVDGKMLGAQVAFRKGARSALVASACSSGNDAAPALAERLARDIVSKL